MKWSLSSLGFDAYERRARLYPGLIAVFPALATPIVLLPNNLLEHVGRTLAGLAVYAGLLYLLANLARSEGKRIEPHLLARWGGWPSTILLRHRDRTIDQYTKRRYHAALAEIAPDVRLPSAEEEHHGPTLADEAYRSATKRLLEKRRAEKYRLIHDANAEYGFRRNMLGLKPFAIAIALIIGLMLLLFLWWPFRISSLANYSFLTDLGERWNVYLLFLCDIVAFLFWVFYVRESWVRQSGFAFAEALLRSLE